MATNFEKSRIHVLVTPAIAFDVDSLNFKIIFTGYKYLEIINAFNESCRKNLEYHCIVETNNSSARIYIKIAAIDGVEYNNNHIYLHRIGSIEYVDLDFSLINDTDSKSICKNIPPYMIQNNRDLMPITDIYNNKWECFTYQIGVVSDLFNIN